MAEVSQDDLRRSVTSEQRALEHVDHLAIRDPDAFLQLLTPQAYINSGIEMMCFDANFSVKKGELIPDEFSGNVILVPITSQLGRERINQFTKGLLAARRNDLSKEQLQKLFEIRLITGTIGGEAFQNAQPHQEMSLLRRVANHNSGASRSPIQAGKYEITVYPVNTIIEYEGHPVGFVMKKGEGRPLKTEGDEYEELRNIQRALGGQGEPTSVLISGIRDGGNKVAVTMIDLGDFTRFVPSTQPLSPPA